MLTFLFGCLLSDSIQKFNLGPWGSDLCGVQKSAQMQGKEVYCIIYNDQTVGLSGWGKKADFAYNGK